MKVLLIALLLATTASMAAQESSQGAPNSTHSAKELRTLLKNAKTRDEFKALSEYYRLQGKAYEVLARERKREWQAELKLPSAGGKYPTAADRARQLYEYAQSSADAAFKTAESYEDRAKAVEAPNAAATAK